MKRSYVAEFVGPDGSKAAFNFRARDDAEARKIADEQIAGLIRERYSKHHDRGWELASLREGTELPDWKDVDD